MYSVGARAKEARSYGEGVTAPVFFCNGTTPEKNTSPEFSFNT